MKPFAETIDLDAIISLTLFELGEMSWVAVLTWTMVQANPLVCCTAPIDRRLRRRSTSVLPTKCLPIGADHSRVDSPRRGSDGRKTKAAFGGFTSKKACLSALAAARRWPVFTCSRSCEMRSVARMGSVSYVPIEFSRTFFGDLLPRIRWEHEIGITNLLEKKAEWKMRKTRDSYIFDFFIFIEWKRTAQSKHRCQGSLECAAMRSLTTRR